MTGFPDIKKAGRTQMHQDDDRATITSSTNIKSKHKKKGKKNRKSSKHRGRFKRDYLD